MNIIYNNKPIANVTDTKFLGRVINNSLTWKTQTEQIIPKLSTACYAIRSVKPT